MINRNYKYLSLLIIIICSFSSNVLAEGHHGQFKGKVQVEWLDDKEGRDMKLIQPFSYKDNAGKIWQVPIGTIINGASIPQYLWTFLGSPYVGKYRKASVIHDYFWKDEASENQELVDLMFREAAKAEGATNSALLYAGVRCCGRSWRFFGRKFALRKVLVQRATNQRICTKLNDRLVCENKRVAPISKTIVEIEKQGTLKKITNPLSKEKFLELKKWVETTKPSPAEIEQHIDKLYENQSISPKKLEPF